MISRRSFFTILSGAIAAPLVAKAEFLMPLRGIRMLPFIEIPKWCPPGWVPCEGQLVTRDQFPELHAALKKMRLFGAEKRDNFNLPDLMGRGPFQWLSGYEEAPDYADTLNRPPRLDQIVSVKIMNAQPVNRSNGNVVPPGSIFDYTLPGLEKAIT